MQYAENNSDEDFLDMVEKKAFLYFWDEADPDTGLVKDRSTADSPSSIAACGFGLTAICIAEKRGWVSHEDAYKRVLTMLETFEKKLENKKGFYYHFVNADTCNRADNSEISSIDTALFLAGALFAGEYFKKTEAEGIVQRLYKRVDWKWMLNKGKTLSHGWTPEEGFIKDRWDKYSEAMVMYLLAIGSSKHSIPVKCWDSIVRQIVKYEGHIFVTAYPNSLFIHQYSHAWVDFRNKHDKYLDYWENSVQAAEANRKFCINNKEEYKTYSENEWGLSASDGPSGYFAYWPAAGQHDGTICPYAIAGSVPLIPQFAIPSLKYIKEKYGDKVWGKYGFYSAFNSHRDWWSKEYIGIDQGITMLMIENYRADTVWEYFMRNKNIQDAMQSVGFVSGKKVLKLPPRETVAEKTIKKIVIDGSLKEWDVKPIELSPEENMESGECDGSKDISGRAYFTWDKDYLYAGFDVTDDKVVCLQTDSDIYKDDVVELFIDPEFNDLVWGSREDFQIGFTPKGDTWAWFQGSSAGDNINIKSKINNDGYTIEAAIKWQFLNIVPEKGKSFGISPAIHDKDESHTQECKLNWYFNVPGIKLGKITLK
ncbi:MAG: hypothetical protein JW983_00810 [Elusimicrobia bacterium]|nr:hypothetical protein [Elusimicrobiota bacterium]